MAMKISVTNLRRKSSTVQLSVDNRSLDGWVNEWLAKNNHTTKYHPPLSLRPSSILVWHHIDKDDAPNIPNSIFCRHPLLPVCLGARRREFFPVVRSKGNVFRTTMLREKPFCGTNEKGWKRRRFWKSPRRSQKTIHPFEKGQAASEKAWK